LIGERISQRKQGKKCQFWHIPIQGCCAKGSSTCTCGFTGGAVCDRQKTKGKKRNVQMRAYCTWCPHYYTMNKSENCGSKAFGVEVVEVEAEVAAVGRVGAS